MENKYPTIEEVIKQEKGLWNILKSVDFFKEQDLPARKLELFKIRQHILSELKVGNSPYICSYCKISVKISGGLTGENTQSLHFRHAKRNPNCIYNDPSKFTREQILCMKFNGAKEGFKHEYLKNTIASILKTDKNYLPIKVEVEKIVRSEIVSKEWRKPDIRAIYPDRKIVFELQLATTFVDVILERSGFYKQEKSYLIWVLDEFSTDLKEQTFSQTDILVSSNYNVFVFDKEMEELSKENDQLYLKCNYIYHVIEESKLSIPLWGMKVITLQQMQYDEEYRSYFYDTEGKKEELLTEIDNRKKKKRQQFYEKNNFQKEPYFQDQPHKQLIDLIRDSREGRFFSELELKLSRLTDAEIEELSDLIHDEIVEWYLESSNQYFIRFILEQERLFINLRRLTIEGTTPLLYLVDRGYEKDIFYACIHSFFIRGYYPEPLDKTTIKNYISFILKKEKLEDDYLHELEKDTIALHYINLYESGLKCFEILYNYRTRQFILRILSVLINQIVGTKQKSFSAIANDVIVNNAEYAHLFIVAMQSPRGSKNDYGKNGAKLLSLFDKSKINSDLDSAFQVIYPNIQWKEKLGELLNN